VETIQGIISKGLKTGEDFLHQKGKLSGIVEIKNGFTEGKTKKGRKKSPAYPGGKKNLTENRRFQYQKSSLRKEPYQDDVTKPEKDEACPGASLQCSSQEVKTNLTEATRKN